jgi:Zn-dependent protease
MVVALILLAALLALVAVAIVTRGAHGINQVYRVDVEDLWRCCVAHPDDPSLTRSIARIDWDPGSVTDGVVEYTTGLRARMEQRPDHARHEVETTVTILTPEGAPMRRMLVHTAVRPDPGGARVLMRISQQRLGGSRGLDWLEALLQPLKAGAIRAEFEHALDQRGALARYAAVHGPPRLPRSVLGMRISFTAAVLAVVACGWWAWSFGPWLTLAMVVGLVAHEAGHVAVMRAFGDRASAFYFIPFLGGVAIGRMRHAQDWQRAAMVLGGPGAGFASALLAGLAGIVTGSDYLVACAWAFAALNLVNLLPIPPLDGGQLLMVALRPGLSPAAQRRVMQALMALGLALCAWAGMWDLVVLFGVLLALALAAAPDRSGQDAVPLAPRHAVGLVVLTLTLAGLLAGVMALAAQDLSFVTIVGLLMDGPFAQ